MASETSRPTAGQVCSKRNLQGLQNWFQLQQQVEAGSLRELTVSISEPTGGLTVLNDLVEGKELGRIIGPLEPAVAQKVHNSPFRVIPKRHALTGKMETDIRPV